ncbi:biotin/lipoyl-binding protein, partial [Undibacterium sp. Ji83W]|uniref:biotin/lipoyl-binding protein n=1 Tax=Undibacterium sp. Ji83W TaxID=3413043 RepID=UPI003BF1FF0B
MSNSSPLFRPEVTAALGSQWMGSIRLAQPLSAALIAIVALIIAAVLIAYITFGSITKKARVTGITVPVGGQLSVAAPNAGILLTTHVKEGEQVKPGQILFTLSTERQNSQGEITALVAQQLASRADSMAAEQRLRQSQYQEKKQALQQRLANLAQEHTQLEQE